METHQRMGAMVWLSLITLVIFLGDGPDTPSSLSISLFLVRRMNGVPLRLDAVRHPALRQD